MATEAQQIHPIVAVSNMLEARTSEYKKMLPAHVPPSKAVRSVIVACQRDPKLLTANRQSLLNAVNNMMDDGLLANGRQGVLVVYKSKDGPAMVQWQPMVQGLLLHAYNSGLLKQIAVDVVREGETFDYFRDETGPHLRHIPGDDDNAPIRCAYAQAVTKDGGIFVEVMSKAAIDKRRAVSRAKDGPMWTNWYPEACKKTVLRSLCKLLPSSNDELDRVSRSLDRDLEAFDLPTEPMPRPRERLSVPETLDRFGGEAPTDGGNGGISEVEAEADAAADANVQAVKDAATEIAPTTINDPIAAARELGRQHRRQGVQRRALPPQYREADAAELAAAWREGWDEPLT